MLTGGGEFIKKLFPSEKGVFLEERSLSGDSFSGSM